MSANGGTQRVRALLEVNRAAEAEAELTRHLAGAPDDWDALLLLAVARLRLDRPEDALEAVARALHAGADGAWPHLLAADAYRQQGQHSLAVAAARRAVAEEPWLADAHYSLAFSLASVPKGLRPARESAEEAARLAPTESAPVALLSRIALEEDRFADAVAMARQALSLDPTDRVAQQVLASVDAVARRFASAGRGTSRLVAGDTELATRAPRLVWSHAVPAATAGLGMLLLALAAVAFGLRITSAGGTRSVEHLLGVASIAHGIAAVLAAAGAGLLLLRIYRLLRAIGGVLLWQSAALARRARKAVGSR